MMRADMHGGAADVQDCRRAPARRISYRFAAARSDSQPCIPDTFRLAQRTGADEDRAHKLPKRLEHGNPLRREDAILLPIGWERLLPNLIDPLPRPHTDHQNGDPWHLRHDP